MRKMLPWILVIFILLGVGGYFFFQAFAPETKQTKKPKEKNYLLLLDQSGSMAPFMSYLKVAAKSFMALKNSKDRILLLPFGDKAEPLLFSKDLEQLNFQIDTLEPEGGTALYSALLTAWDMSEQNKGHSTIILMTDGKASDISEEKDEELFELITEKPIRIYAVGLGAPYDIDELFLKKITKASGGTYYQTEEAPQLERIFREIALEVFAPDPLRPPPTPHLVSPVP